MTNIFDTVYFGAAIQRTLEVLARQQQICTEYELLPRGELHMTLGFVGKISQEQLETLGSKLARGVPGPLQVLAPSGLGGCFEVDGVPRLWDQLPGRQPSTVARVLWWAIRSDPAIVRLRELFARAIGEMGLPLPSGDPFSPHVTLGSAGPEDSRPEDFALWDVHTLPKGPNISTELAPRELLVESLHLTSVAVHPASLVRVA